ncbi:MAG: hypothetical protein IJY72_06730, partial [Akkermansia sp.]|nr:hypothetical protein [Akkermansia sp.]
MTIPHFTTRIGLLSLGLLPVVPAVVAAVAPVAVAAPATKLSPDVHQALVGGRYNQVQQLLTDALKGRKISPDSPQVLHEAMLLELIRTTGADVMSTFAASHPRKASFLCAL